MSSLVSGQLMGVFQRRHLCTGADETAQTRLITSMTTVENSQRTRTRMRERMLSDSHWFMCALEVQTTNSGTMRTASVSTGTWVEIVSTFITRKGCQQRYRLEPHTIEAQSVSAFEGQVVHSRPKGQEQHLPSVGSNLSSRTGFPPSFSDPFSFTSLLLISTPLPLLSESNDLLTICFLAHRSAYFRRALPITFTTIA